MESLKVLFLSNSNSLSLTVQTLEEIESPKFSPQAHKICLPTIFRKYLGKVVLLPVIAIVSFKLHVAQTLWKFTLLISSKWYT